MSLASNVAARQAVELLLELVPDVLKPEVNPLRFWELLAETAASRCHRVVVAADHYDAMTDAQAERFENTVVPYGAHAGKRVGDVNPEYFSYITQSEFANLLVRYLRSDYYRNKQGLMRWEK